MGYKLGILISGNGSNMLNIIEASRKKLIKSKVATVVSDNPLAKINILIFMILKTL